MTKEEILKEIDILNISSDVAAQKIHDKHKSEISINDLKWDGLVLFTIVLSIGAYIMQEYKHSEEMKFNQCISIRNAKDSAAAVVVRHMQAFEDSVEQLPIVVSHLGNIPTTWTIIDSKGNIKYLPKNCKYKVTVKK